MLDLRKETPDQFSLLLDLPLETVAGIPKTESSERNAIQIMSKLSKTCKSFYGFFQPKLNILKKNKDLINKALAHAANRNIPEEVSALLTMLEENPQILLMRGNVFTPAGLNVREVTLIEFILGEGDNGLAHQVSPFFKQIENGEYERNCQYERYKLHIEDMCKHKPYDLTPVFDAIKEASSEDMKAYTDNDFAHSSKLREALLQFKKDLGPRVLTEPCMHYSLINLVHAFGTFRKEFVHLAADKGAKLNFATQHVLRYLTDQAPQCDKPFVDQVYDFFHKTAGCYSIVPYVASFSDEKISSLLTLIENQNEYSESGNLAP